VLKKVFELKVPGSQKTKSLSVRQSLFRNNIVLEKHSQPVTVLDFSISFVSFAVSSHQGDGFPRWLSRLLCKS